MVNREASGDSFEVAISSESELSDTCAANTLRPSKAKLQTVLPGGRGELCQLEKATLTCGSAVHALNISGSSLLQASFRAYEIKTLKAKTTPRKTPAIASPTSTIKNPNINKARRHPSTTSTAGVRKTGQIQSVGPPARGPSLKSPRLDPAAAAQAFRTIRAFARNRLLEPHSSAASSMIIRPRLKETQEELLKILLAAVEKPGASTSCLLIGARGLGKTLVAERVLSEIHAKFNGTQGPPVVGMVRLSGLLHAEERTAYREIARQLCLTFNCPFTKSASLEENLFFLRAMLKELRNTHKLIIFLLDEFDLFARKSKQSILYNLLDALQSSDMQAAVVGLSTRVDVMEMLEKRVRSRFSYRRYMVPECEEGSPEISNRDTAPAVLEEMLKLPEGIVANEYATQWNAALETHLQHPDLQDLFQQLQWKGMATPRCMAEVALHAVCRSSVNNNGVLNADDLKQGLITSGAVWVSHGQMIPSLSILEMFILAALQRLKKQNQPEVNFQMVWKEYSKLKECSREGHVDSQYNRAAACRAFERLMQLGLIAVSRTGLQHQAMLREFEPVWLTVSYQELQEGMEKHLSCPPSLAVWLNNDTAIVA
eukprot:jgi/Botrbrau1/19901/Bobra.0059s0022.1